MIEFKLNQSEIGQLYKEIANFDVILNALKQHNEIDLFIDEEYKEPTTSEALDQK